MHQPKSTERTDIVSIELNPTHNGRDVHGPGDGHLAESVQLALRATGYAALRCITVTVSASVITLNGRVSTYYLKQLAQTAILRVAGIRQILNDVQVG